MFSLLLAYCLQCIQRLKAERTQLQEQVKQLEESLDQCRTENAKLQQLQHVQEQLQAKTAECEKLTACNVCDLRNCCDY